MSSASLSVVSLQKALGIPSTPILIDGTTFVLYVIPPVVCYFIVALLAVTPRTGMARVALWPLVALLALRAALSVDVSFGKAGYEFNNTNLVLFMFAATVRTLDWTLAKGPLVRHTRPANSAPSTIMDALDLASSFRGHGWEWSRGLNIPSQTRPVNRVAFAFSTFLSAIAHTLVCGTFYRAVLTLVPVNVGPIPGGATIFDEALPFLVRYVRAGIISILDAIALYGVLQMNYDVFTLLAVLVLGQDPAQWPPAFDAPWRATSLSDFWGRRWHQFFRRIYVFLGGYPLSLVLGRAGIVIGAFLASVLWHQIALLTLNSEIEVWWMLLGFGMMGPGVLAERAFYRLTGKRVGGFVGWVWTMSWLLVWGTMIVEGFARGGIFGCTSAIDQGSPLRAPVERLATDLDLWLRTI